MGKETIRERQGNETERLDSNLRLSLHAEEARPQERSLCTYDLPAEAGSCKRSRELLCLTPAWYIELECKNLSLAHKRRLKRSLLNTQCFQIVWSSLEGACESVP